MGTAVCAAVILTDLDIGIWCGDMLVQEWWQPGESQMRSQGDFSTFRRTRSSFTLPVSSGPSNELSALPSFGWLVRFL